MELAGTEVQQSFDDLITGILARFASGTNADVVANIEASLREIAEFVGADYAHVVRTVCRSIHVECRLRVVFALRPQPVGRTPGCSHGELDLD